MAISKCVSCGNTNFELKTQEPSGSRVKINFIQCSNCGVVVGVTDFMSVGTNLAALSEKVGQIDTKIDSLAASQSNIQSVLAHLTNR